MTNVIHTNWYVITGGPSSGKTKTIESLSALGHPTVPEAARAVIDRELGRGRRLKDIRGDESLFQRQVMELMVETETNVIPERMTFFDRGMPDSLAYRRLHGVELMPARVQSRIRRYRAVFLLSPLPFRKDYARTEDATTARQLHDIIGRVYLSLGYPIVSVPVMSVEERVRFILDHTRLIDESA